MGAEVWQSGKADSPAIAVGEADPIHIGSVAVFLRVDVVGEKLVHRSSPQAESLGLLCVPVRFARPAAKPLHLIEGCRQCELDSEAGQGRWHPFAGDAVDFNGELTVAGYRVGVVAIESNREQRRCDAGLGDDADSGGVKLFGGDADGAMLE